MNDEKPKETNQTVIDDPEIAAIEKILLAMQPFDIATRRRIIGYAQSWANDPKTQPPNSSPF